MGLEYSAEQKITNNRDEKEKQKKKNDLQRKIRELESKKTLLDSQIDKLRREKQQLESVEGLWNSLRAEGLTNTDLIKINIFEGMLAERTVRSFDGAVTTMGSNIMSVDRVNTNISTQIKILENQISSINKQISNLKSRIRQL